MRSEPGPDFPTVFSSNFLKLIDLKLKMSNPLIENPGYRYLSERGFAKTRYSRGTYQPRALITAKGVEYLVRSKIADFSTLRFDIAKSGQYLYRLGQMEKEKLVENQNSEWDTIPTLIYLGLALRNPYRVTRRGKKLLSYFARYMPMILVAAAPALPWWREYLVDKIPLSEWAYVLTELDKDDRIVYANLLRARRENLNLRTTDNLS